MNTEERIVKAWRDAQSAFRAMLLAKSYGDPEAPETLAYIEAEVALDAILGDVQSVREARMSPAVHDPDCDCYHIARQQLEESRREEAEGDHFAYPAHPEEHIGLCAVSSCPKYHGASPAAGAAR